MSGGTHSRSAAEARAACLLAAAMLGALAVASPLAAEETNDRGSAKAPEPAAARPGSPAVYRALAESEARRAGMPGEIADAVMAVESGYDPSALGSVGEIGLMQVLPSTARALGFDGRMERLAVPETNIRYGVKYLAGAWRLAGGDLCTAVMKYRAGHGETRFSHRSVDYCLAVRAKLMARGYPVAGIVPIATFGDAAPSRLRSALVVGCRRNCLAASGRAELDFDAINTRLDHIVIQANANAVRLR
ncbi:transglycosylase-like protein with SLT domain [Methylosinus sp. sav-2]|uniref:lytic transglycosylase domain-containing protein n=1 Tax=Methylosinus sp. sav-2 TaxID=2485168 RepID=UPI000AD3FF00|nr:transglycosylase SLT domain-containing protein [Methylosinus sp. sav-2]TDX61393.1 transglycosylase-like protein with SLT domain [Methylosinus sp. sav-2]